MIHTSNNIANSSQRPSIAYGAKEKAHLDYYPFGMLMPSRNSSASQYRYGFNGKEKDDELKGNGNSYDFGARIYDPRIGRFLSIDPRSSDFVHLSPYVSSTDNPIYYIDQDGEGALGDFFNKLYNKAKKAIIRKVKEKAVEATIEFAQLIVMDIKTEYEEKKEEMVQNNKEQKLSYKFSVPVGLLVEENVEVAGQKEGFLLEILSTDLFSVEYGVKMSKDGLETVIDFDVPFDGEGFLVRSSAALNLGPGKVKASQEFRLMSIDDGMKGVIDDKQTISFSAGAATIEKDITNERTTIKTNLSKTNIGLGIGVRSVLSISESYDSETN